MCDKKNSVLFNDIKCVILSPHFKLTDESHVLLKVPRKNNMYSVDLKNVVPKGGLTCLFVKATSDESNLWHRRLGHGKQHNVSGKTKTVSSISQPLQMLYMDLFGPTFVKSLMKKMYCLVVTDDFSRKPALSFMRPFRCHVIILNTIDHLGKFDGKADEGFFVGYSTNSKAFKVFNSRTKIVEENMHVKFREDTNQPSPPLMAPPEAPQMVSSVKLHILKNGHSSQAQGSSSYADELIFSSFAIQSSSPQLDNEDLEQIDQDDLKEIDLNWQVAMLSIRVKGRYAGNAGYRGRDNGKRPAREEDEKALVVLDGLGTYNWSYHLKEKAIDFALMAFTSNHSSSSRSNSEPKEVRTNAPLIQEWDTDSDNDSVFRPKHIPAKINFVKADRMAKKSVLPNNMGKGTGHRESSPVWNNVQRINHKNKFTSIAVFTRSGRIPVSATKPKATASTSVAKPVNTAGPK
nr:hypothetical protein [Tanacetum cinerariifolium]